MSLFHESIPPFARMLGNLERWLDEAAEYADSRGFDPEVFTTARLCPDQFPLTRQIQAACDAAKFTAARLSGQEAPSHPDTETTLAELRARIATTLAYLANFSAEDFEGKEQDRHFLPFLKGGFVTSEDYLRQFAAANFHFHITVAYSILRHNGVKLGKRAYIGHMNVQMPDA